MIEVAILAWLAPEVPRLLDVRLDAQGSRRALRLTVVGPLAPLSVSREGELLTLVLGAEARAGLVAPAPQPPVHEIRVQPAGSETRVLLRVEPSASHEVERHEGQVVLLLADAGAKPAPPSTAELYRGLFAQAAGEAEPVSVEASEPGASDGDSETSGLQLGALTLHPAIALSAIRADATPVAGVPIEERQLHIEPRLGFDLALGQGRLEGAYTLHLRRGTRIPELSAITESTSHRIDATLELPMGPSFELRLDEHFATGVLETDEVDPGYEYFTNLARYRRNQVDAELRYRGAGRLGLEAGGRYNSVTIDDEVAGQPGVPAGFFDYDVRGVRAGIFYELTPSLEATLDYGRFDTPAPEERPLAESTLDAVALHVKGDLSPLTQAELAVGYERRESPRASGDSRVHGGLGLGLSLQRELAEGTVVQVGASRATQLSAFEENAYYVASSVAAEATRRLPWALSLRAGAGYHWNDYKIASASLGEPRSDRIFGWSVGVGRSLSRWAYLRVDYARQDRDSNVRAFENVTDSLVIQAGIAYGEAR